MVHQGRCGIWIPASWHSWGFPFWTGVCNPDNFHSVSILGVSRLDVLRKMSWLTDITDHLKLSRYSNNMKTAAGLLWVLYSKSGVHIILATHLYSHLQSQGFKKVPSGRPSCYSLKNTLPQLPAPHLALPFQQVEAELRAGATWTLPAARPGTGWLTLLGGRGWPVTANLA